MIERDIQPLLLTAAGAHPVVTLTGPRQSGKSTVCRSLFATKPYVSLEAPDTRSFAAADPRSFLAQYPEGAVLDEVQRVPALPSYLQGLVDADPVAGRWVLTGSQNLQLLESVSQSLAGRSAVMQLLPLARSEVVRFAQHPEQLDQALMIGGYPRIFDRQLDASDWLRSYVATYLERDVRAITKIGDLVAFQRFVELCAGRTGQLLNYSSLGADAGVAQPTARAWMSVLETSFVAFRLPAFHANHRKRMVKMPKLHFYDSGLACWLLGIRNPDHLRSHPLRGAIFESWVVSEILKHRTNRGESAGLSFYRDKDGVEADVVVDLGDRLLVVEVKSTATASDSLVSGAERVMRHVGAAGRPVESLVVYGGDDLQRRSHTTLVPWHRLHELAWAPARG